jgi:GDPmannose 4,6-dehydratase
MIRINPNFYRPTDVTDIQGDSSKIRKVLNWTPEYNLQDLVNDMCKSDMEMAYQS